MANYLPEWQLYLLKKLALDAAALSNRTLTTNDFLYVTKQEAAHATEESLHQTMQYIQSIPNRVYAGEKLRETVGSISLAGTYMPPQFDPVAIMKALIELSSEPDVPVRFMKIMIGKEYFDAQERKRIASITSGRPPFTEMRGRKMVSLSEDAIKNGMRELPKDPFDTDTLKDILGQNPNLAERIVFQLEIDAAKVNKKINAYLDDFQQQKLIPSKGHRYLAVKEQESRFLAAIAGLEKRFGRNNISTNFTEIIQMGGRENWGEESCRFYEALFLLEKEKSIKIVDLRGLEVVFSVIQTPTPTRKVERFSVEREFAKVQEFKDEAGYRAAQVKWLNVKFVVGEISKALPPLKSKLPQSLSLNTREFTEVQKGLVPYVMEYLLDIGALNLPPLESSGIITTKPLRKALNGEFAIISNQDAIEEYTAQIYELCDRIDKYARLKFSKRDMSILSESSRKKILKVLDVIHDRYELMTKEPQWQYHGATAVLGDGGGRMNIHTREFLVGSALNFDELRAILGTLKNDGLLDSFEFVSEYA